MENNQIKFEVGRRYLLKRNYYFPIEIKVLEISPDEKFVKFHYENGGCGWERIDNEKTAIEIELDEDRFVKQD